MTIRAAPAPSTWRRRNGLNALEAGDYIVGRVAIEAWSTVERLREVGLIPSGKWQVIGDLLTNLLEDTENELAIKHGAVCVKFRAPRLLWEMRILVELTERDKERDAVVVEFVKGVVAVAITVTHDFGKGGDITLVARVFMVTRGTLDCVFFHYGNYTKEKAALLGGCE